MGVIFISHSSRNNPQAIEVRDWLRMNGWHDTFLDLDPAHGLAPGQRWQEELKKAGERCSGVVVLISPEWLASKWCQVEFLVASQLGKQIFPVMIAATEFADLPIELTARYQVADISDPTKKGDGLERLRWGLKRAGLDPRDFAWPPPDEPQRSPYRGLRSLEEKDAAIFFGRDAEITRGLDTLRRMRGGAPERVLVVLGASGAGKSSFLKAGLLARLRRDEERFLVLPTVRPARASLTGPEGLLKALGVSTAPTLDTLKSRLDELRAPLTARFERFAAAAGEAYRGKAPTVVLPIDQGEELFGSDSKESAEVFDLVRHVVAVDDNFLIVMTIRSDSYANLQAERRLADVPRLPFDLAPLSPVAFKQVIEGPGRLVQPEIVFEPALTDRLVADLDQAGALPLLAFTLERLLIGYGQDRRLELREYEQELGGLEGAIDGAIGAAFAAAAADRSLPSDRPALEALARRAFIPWLVTVQDVEDTPRRRVAAVEELPEETRPLIRYFVSQRVLVSDVHEDQETLEVSHESVLRHWRILSNWIDEERSALLALEAVRRATAEWHRRIAAGAGGSEWLVHRGERLVQADELSQRRDYARLLGESGRAYLEACRSREQAERADAEQRLRREHEQIARQRRLQRRATLALALVALVILAFGYLAVRQSRSASREASLVLADYAQRAMSAGQYERATRFAMIAAREGLLTAADAAAAPTLAAAADHSTLLLGLPGRDARTSWIPSADGRRLLSLGGDGTVRLWDPAAGTEIARLPHDLVSGASFAADGRRVLSWGKDGTVRVWNATSGAEVARQAHSGLSRATFAADGRRVLSWGYDGSVRIWDAASGAQVAHLPHPDVLGASFSADGQRVLSWGEDGTARVWNATSGLEIARQTHDGSVAAAKFAGDGRHVLSWDGDWAIRVWNATSGAEIGRRMPAGALVDAVFSADSTHVLSWGDGTIRVWDAASGAEVAHATHDRVSGATFAAEGGRVLSWGEDGTGRVWDAMSGREIARQTHQRAVRGARFSADGRAVLSWSADGTVRVWDATSGTEIARQTHPGAVLGVIAVGRERALSWDDTGMLLLWTVASRTIGFNECTSPGAVASVGDRRSGLVAGATFVADGARVLSSCGDGSMRLWSAPSGTEIARQTRESDLVDAIFSADGTRVLSWGRDGTVRVQNATSGVEIARKTHMQIEGATFAADGRRVLSWAGDGSVHVWDAASGAEIARQTHARGPVRAAFSADGTRVLSWGGDGIVRVWNARSGVEIAHHTHAGGVDYAVFSADGSRVLSWGGDDIVRVWDAASGAEVAHLAHVGVSGATFAADGRRVLSWGDDGTTLVWDTTTGIEVARQTHGGWVAGATFAADGRRVLSWGEDGTARVWDAASGVEIARQTHAQWVTGATFAANGRRVFSWGDDGTVRVWDTASGTEIARQTHPGRRVEGATLSADGRRVLSWDDGGTARLWDASWSVPRDSNRSLIAEVCRDVLRGPEVPVPSFVNGSGKTIDRTSVRRITTLDAVAAPLLRDRVGEDVCGSAGWFSRASDWLHRLF